MPRPHDPIKAALADLTFAALQHAVHEMPGSALNPAHTPLEDCILEVVPYSDYEATVRVAGHGKVQFYAVKVQRQ